MIFVDESSYISRAKLARVIEKQYADCQNRMNVQEERQIAMDEMIEEYPNATDVENWNRLPDAMKRSRIKAYMDVCDKLNQIFVMEELRRPPLPITISVDDDGVTHFGIEHAMEINTSNPVLEQIQALEKEVFDYIFQTGKKEA